MRYAGQARLPDDLRNFRGRHGQMLIADTQRQHLSAIALSRLLKDIAGLYETTRHDADPHVRLVQDEGDAVTVPGREGPLSQVFRNLIDNARSFSPAGGDVWVTLSRERGQAVVKIDDSGRGMPPENLETVFERFYTARPRGAAFGGNSGLGLSIARQIVEAHGGKLHAENRVNAAGEVTGARFVVSIPATRPAPGAQG